jgi:hypothetical protein
MTTDKSIIQKSFQPWKIALAVMLGLSVAFFMLYRSLNETHFIEVSSGGTHNWVDANHNGTVDRQNASEFVLASNGTYKQQQITDVLSEINWTTQSLLWILLALIFIAGRDAAFMWRVRTFTNKDLSWKQSFYVIMIWEFASALAPGVAGGTAVAMFILNKEKIELGRSTAIVFVSALMDNLFFVLSIPCVLFFIDVHALFPEENAATTSIHYLFWLAYAIKLITVLFLIITLFVYPKLIAMLLNLIFRLPFLKKWRNNVKNMGENLVVTSQIMRKENGKFWFKIFGLMDIF